MRYIALLRGVNVGGNHKVEMKRLKKMLEHLGYSDVSTYLNSGNALFEASKKPVLSDVSQAFKNEFGFEVPILIKTMDEMQSISESIPKDWKNDADWKCDVAYLFEAIDSEKTINALPVKNEFIDIRYTNGAIFWLVKRSDYQKSHINKIIGHKHYPFMTIRNVNTARFLGKMSMH